MTDHMSAAREGIKRMRALAEAAGMGPWETWGDGLVWADRPGDPVAAANEAPDAAFIAAADPTFVTAVLDAAEKVLDRHAPDDLDEAGFCDDCGYGWPCSAVEPWLAVFAPLPVPAATPERAR